MFLQVLILLLIILIHILTSHGLMDIVLNSLGLLTRINSYKGSFADHNIIGENIKTIYRAHGQRGASGIISSVFVLRRRPPFQKFMVGPFPTVRVIIKLQSLFAYSSSSEILIR